LASSRREREAAGEGVEEADMTESGTSG